MLSPTQWYHWDVSGYVVLPQAVDSAVLEAAAAAGATAEVTDAGLMAALDQLFGEPEGESQQVGYRLPGMAHNFRLQRPPEVSAGPAPPAELFSGQDLRRCYFNERLVNLPYPAELGLPRGIVMGVTTLVALAPGGVVSVVPASHASLVAAPPASGGAVAAALLPVNLAPGDLLLMSSNLLHRIE